MVYLIDANVIVRFLTGVPEEHFEQACRWLEEVEAGDRRVLILEGVLMEAWFVLTRFYKLPKREVADDLKAILHLTGVVNPDKLILAEALTMAVQHNIDFVDALICAKARLEGYGKLSFDRDVMVRCEHPVSD